MVDLHEIYEAEKTLPVDPDWRVRPHERWSRLVCPIDIDGETVEGLRLGITASPIMPDEAVTFQLEYVPPRRDVKGGPMSRIEWRSLSPHNNKGLGPPEYQFKLIKECHEHCFYLNWEHSTANVRRGHLPIAIPLKEEYTSFVDALAFVSKQFNIKDISSIS